MQQVLQAAASIAACEKRQWLSANAAGQSALLVMQTDTLYD
jgi:hypothetical protein